MKKLFISQPMKGKTNEEIEAERAKAVEEAKAVLNDDVEYGIKVIEYVEG